MILESDLRSRLAAIAQNQMSLDAFEAWIGPASRNAHKDSSPGALELVSAIHFLFAERDGSLLDESALRRELLTLLNNVHGAMIISPRGVSQPPMLNPPSSSSYSYWVQPPPALRLPAEA